MLGKGTATSEQLSIYGLSNTEKAIVSTVATAESTRQLIRAAKRKLYMDIPGNGIMLTVPIKSVAGGRTLAYLTGNKTPTGGAPDLQFEHELIIAVLNAGYSDAVMDAARTAGAGGGTVLHARGTGTKQAEKFFGVSLAEEKDILYIVAPARQKAAIMSAINATTGAAPKPARSAFRCRCRTSSACARWRTKRLYATPYKTTISTVLLPPLDAGMARRGVHFVEIVGIVAFDYIALSVSLRSPALPHAGEPKTQPIGYTASHACGGGGTGRASGL